MGLIGWMQMGDGAVAVSEEPPAPAWDTDAPLPWYAPPPSERFGVLLIAAGEDAAHYAQALQRHPCCRPDPGAGFTGALRLTLAHAPAAAGPTSAHERTDAYLEAQSRAALLVVFVVSEDGPWCTAFAAQIALLRDVPDAKLIFVDLRDAAGSRAAAEGYSAGTPRGLLMGPSSVGGARAGNEQLDSAAAALLYALFQSGFVCLDYARYMEALSGVSGTAAVGFGRTEGATGLSNALEDAYTDWARDATHLGTAPEATMLIVGDPLDDPASLHDLQSTAESFLADRLPESSHHQPVAIPVLPPGATEVVLVTWHAVVGR